MRLFSRVTLAVLALTLVAAAPAAAESVKIEVPAPAPQPTYLFFEGNADGTGELIVCVAGSAFGGHYDGGTSGGEYAGDPCPDRTGDVTLPPAGGGGGGPAPPCGDMASCQTLLESLVPEGGGGGGPAPPCGDMASCQAFFESLVPEGGGGGGPAPPCTDPASCQAFFEGLLGGGGGGAPGPRDCTGASGGGATCVDLGEGNFLLGDPPDDGAGELGLCIQGTYFYVAGPEPPDGGAGEACPAPAPVTTVTPGESGSGGGSTAPPPNQSGGSSDGGSQPTQQPSESGSTSQPQPEGSRPADPPEACRVDVMARRLSVSRTGRTAVPIECLTVRTACRGVLRLTTTRRTKSGRRVRVLLARADFLVRPGRILERKVRLTRAGRRMLAARGRLRARVTTSVANASGPVVSSERLVLRRR
jgi:hypothetical protein